MKKTNFLKWIYFAILLLTLSQSCRQENLLIESENNSAISKPVISVLDYSEIETDKALVKELGDLQKKFNRNSNFSARTIQDSLLDGAVIEINKVLLIEDGDKKTYTFPISRTFPNNKIENLVLKKNADNSFSGLLAQYTITDQQKQLFMNGQSINLGSNAKFYRIDNINISARVQTDVVGCFRITWETGYCASGQHNASNAGDCKLKSGVPEPKILAIEDECQIESGGGSFGSGSSGGMSGGVAVGSGGGGGGPVAPSSPYNTYIFMSYDDVLLFCPQDDAYCAENWANQVATVNFFSSLGRNSVLSEYNNIFFAVKDYLVDNGFSSDSKDFLAERLNLIGNWFRTQSNTDPDLKINNFKFAHWALRYLFDNQEAFDYFKNHSSDLGKIKLQGVDYTNTGHLEIAKKLTPIFTELIRAEQNNTVNQINVQNPIWKAAKDYMIYLIKSNAPKAVEYGRIIYEHANKYFKSNPDSLQKVNDFIEFMKLGVIVEVPVITNPHYMKWTDVLLCWLFEIGDFPVNDSAGYGALPTIGFSGSDYTISGQPAPNVLPMRYLAAHKIKNGVPDPNSVAGIRKKAIDNIKVGVFSNVEGNWIFGSDATVDTVTKLDGMQFCIGSYQPIVYITPLGNSQYKLTFIVKNKTGWQSGTRGLNDYNGNPTDDSIVNDQPRGTGVHLGGTIAETFGWYEIVTVP